jgi:hypothetical protein
MQIMLSAGIEATLEARDGTLDLGPSEIVVEPNTLTVGANAAQTSVNQSQLASLWPTSSISFRTPRSGGTKFELLAQSSGIQAWVLSGTIIATLDVPRAVDGSRLRFTGPGLFGLESNASGDLLLLSEITSNLTPLARSYALKNLLLQLNGPNLLTVRGTYDAQSSQITTGTLVLTYDYTRATPFLPDPYTISTNTTPRSSLSTAASTLTITMSWQPNTPVTIDLSLPTTSSAQSNKLLEASSSTANPELPGLTLLDLSSNVSQFGVAVAPAREAQAESKISDLYLQIPASDLRVVTLPAVQWEPVVTPDQSVPFTSPLIYPDNGPVTVLGTQSVTLTPIAPRQTIDEVLESYNTDSSPSIITAQFTLPFGLVANATLSPSRIITRPPPRLSQVQPTFTSSNAGAMPQTLTGMDQLSIRASQPLIIGPGPRKSPTLAGSMQMLDVALDQNGNKAGVTITSPIDVNPTFEPGGTSPSVPVTRIDLSGYGESMFSDWRNPSGQAATISKVDLEVLVGRTSREVVQLFSVLYPYAVRVVRTITIERQNGGGITRADSGWQAVSDGTYAYPDAGLVTHPGVVRGVSKVVNIRDSGQTYVTPDATKVTLMAVRFNCSVQMENVVVGQGSDGLVPALDQLGYVQIAPQGQLTAAQYATMISSVGLLGGTIDCTINVGGSGMSMRVIRIGVGATPASSTTTSQFVMGAWGSPILPAGGQWSWVQLTAATTAPQAVDPSNGVPLVRAGPSIAPAPAANPYRFSDPAEVLTGTGSSTTYGIVHSTGTQRLLILAPVIQATTPFAVTSTVAPSLADPFSLGTSTGPFPSLPLAIPFNDANFQLLILGGNNLSLKLPSPSFTTAVRIRVIRQSQTFSSISYTADENGKASVVTLAIDTTAVAPAKTWSVSITNLSLATETGSLGEVTRVVGSIAGDSSTPTTLTDSRLVFGPALKPVAALIAFLENFGPLTPLTLSMTNDWSLQAGLQISLDKFLMEIPELKDFLTKFVDDFDIKMESKTSPTSASFLFQIELTIKVPTSFGPVAIGIAEVEFNLSDDGAIWEFTLGVGIGVEFKVGPFDAIAYYAQTQSLITGDNVFGVGAGSVVKGSIDLEVVSVEVSIEAKIEMLKVTCNSDESSIWGVAQVTFAIDVTIFWVIDIEFDAQAQWTNNFDSGPCTLPG